MSQISEEVSRYISQEILHRSVDETLDAQLNLLHEGILDSLGLQLLVAFLEERFSISIGDDDLLPENFETIAAITGFVSGLR